MTTESQQAIDLLKKLIVTPSPSGKEEFTAQIISDWFENNGIVYLRKHNNIIAQNKYFDPKKPSILLNSHHDTVQPNNAYEKNPYNPEVSEGKLYGLGSNDAGGALVTLLVTFKHFYDQKGLSHNLIIAATAEEENSGENGIQSILEDLPAIDFAIVGEPTQMKMAIAEKGLLVLDGYAYGVAGHVAHGTTSNAIHNALKDIEIIKSLKFPDVSETLGEVKVNVTQINAGKQHNVLPAECHFVVDARVNECYTNQEVFALINDKTRSHIKARSFDLNPSFIPLDHPFVQIGIEYGLEYYGSPTLSDQVYIKVPSLKMGPGDSLRSHAPDEFIYIKEIEEGIEIYRDLLTKLLKS